MEHTKPRSEFMSFVRTSDQRSIPRSLLPFVHKPSPHCLALRLLSRLISSSLSHPVVQV